MNKKYQFLVEKRYLVDEIVFFHVQKKILRCIDSRQFEIQAFFTSFGKQLIVHLFFSVSNPFSGNDDEEKMQTGTTRSKQTSKATTKG